MLERYCDVLTIHDLMEILGVGQNTAYALIKKGSIASIRIGRQIRIPKQSVIDFLKKASYTDDSNMFCAQSVPTTKGADL